MAISDLIKLQKIRHGDNGIQFFSDPDGTLGHIWVQRFHEERGSDVCKMLGFDNIDQLREFRDFINYTLDMTE